MPERISVPLKNLCTVIEYIRITVPKKKALKIIRVLIDDLDAESLECLRCCYVNSLERED